MFLTDPTNLTAPILIGGNFSVAGSDNIPYYNLARLTWTDSAFAVDITFPHIFNQVVPATSRSVRSTPSRCRGSTPPATSWWVGITCRSRGTPATIPIT